LDFEKQFVSIKDKLVFKDDQFTPKFDNKKHFFDQPIKQQDYI
jgi:hypothetical protein